MDVETGHGYGRGHEDMDVDVAMGFLTLVDECTDLPEQLGAARVTVPRSPTATLRVEGLGSEQLTL